VRIGFIRPRQVGQQGHRGNARQHDDHRHQQFKKCREHDTLLGLADALGAERALDDVLVKAPIRDIHHPHAAQQHRQPRQVLVVGVARRQDHVKSFRKASRQDVKACDDAAAIGNAVQRHRADDQTAEYQ